MEFFQINIFVLLDKICKIYKVVYNPRHWLLRIGVKVLSPPKDDLLGFIKFKFRHVSSFTCIWEKMVKFSVKIPFWHTFAYMTNSFVFHYISQLRLIPYKIYSKFCTRKCKKHFVICIAIIMTYQWSTLIPIWHSWG